MKNIRIFAASLLAAGTIGFINVKPASALFFTYTAGIQIQNLETIAANIVIKFYDKNGAEAGTTSDTVSASGSKTYFPLNAVSSGFNGSAIVSSDKQVASVVNILGNNGVAAASYIGFAAGAPNLEIPLLMKNNSGYNTWFNVQNAGSATTNITVNYSDGTSVTANNVAPGASATFDQSTETHGLAVFAATVSSSGSQPVVASVVEESASTMFAYNSFVSGSQNPVMPLINANNSGFITGVQIKNGSTSTATNVTVSYTPSAAGTACTETQAIPAGQSATFALGAFTSGVGSGVTTNCALGATFIGSAKVTANSGSVPLSVIVNQLNTSTNAGEAYSGFDATSATNKVVMPLIMDRNSGYYTGFSVMNVGSAATNINCTFSGSTATQSLASVPVGGAFTALQLNIIANGYVGSATCTSDAGSKLVGIVNELNSSGGDKFLVYEAITSN
jgi:hypothetical protein